MRRKGFLLVLSGPSGSGKNTILSRLIKACSGLRYSISATTRPPRPGERDGVDYYFLTHEGFRDKVSSGEFLEWAEVYGHLYGTPKTPLEKNLSEGLDCVLDIDIQGARTLRRTCPDAVLVFVTPPSMRELVARMTGRGLDGKDAIATRLQAVSEELEAIGDYEYFIMNDRLEETTEQLKAIVLAERCKTKRAALEEFMNEFKVWSGGSLSSLRPEEPGSIGREYGEYGRCFARFVD